MNSTIVKQIAYKALRHGLTAFGGAGIATDSNVERIFGAISFLAGIAWSIYEAKNAPKKEVPVVDVESKQG